MIHTPWAMSLAEQAASGCRIGRDYPHPIVDHEASAREARRRLAAVRRGAEARAEGREILREHGSRRRSARVRARPASNRAGEPQ